MALLVHASLHSIVDPDPVNDPNETDIVWQAAEPSNPNIVAPIRFRVEYCEGPYSSTGCRWYEGFVEISNEFPPAIKPALESAPWPKAGVCGQSLDPPFPSTTSIVSYAPWYAANPENQGLTFCGTDAFVSDPECASFVDTDHLLWIARTAQNPDGPFAPILCFKRIEVWIDGDQADKDELLFQHDFNSTTQSPCKDEDRYSLVSTPKQTVTRSAFDTHECAEASLEDNYPGGQQAETCVMAIFEPNP